MELSFLEACRKAGWVCKKNKKKTPACRSRAYAHINREPSYCDRDKPLCTATLCSTGRKRQSWEQRAISKAARAAVAATDPRRVPCKCRRNVNDHKGSRKARRLSTAMLTSERHSSPSATASLNLKATAYACRSEVPGERHPCCLVQWERKAVQAAEELYENYNTHSRIERLARWVAACSSAGKDSELSQERGPRGSKLLYCSGCRQRSRGAVRALSFDFDSSARASAKLSEQNWT